MNHHKWRLMNVSHFGSSAFTYALPELPRHHRLRHRLAWIMQETPQRDCGDGRATGQPSRGTAGLDLRRTCEYVARFETRGRPEGRPFPRSQLVVRA